MSAVPAISLATDRLEAGFEGVSTDAELFRAIVNTPFVHLKVETTLMFLGIVVFLQVNKTTGNIDRIALSNTELAKNTTDVSTVAFHDIIIPVNHPENILSRAIQTGEPQDTTDWKYLFEPAMTPEQARINQASGGIAYSAVYPLMARNGGALIFSYFQYLSEIGETQHEFMRTYAAIVDKHLG